MIGSWAFHCDYYLMQSLSHVYHNVRLCEICLTILCSYMNIIGDFLALPSVRFVLSAPSSIESSGRLWENFLSTFACKLYDPWSDSVTLSSKWLYKIIKRVIKLWIIFRTALTNCKYEVREININLAICCLLLQQTPVPVGITPSKQCQYRSEAHLYIMYPYLFR